MFPNNLNDFCILQNTKYMIFQQHNFRKNFKNEGESNPGCSDL